MKVASRQRLRELGGEKMEIASRHRLRELG